MLATGMGRGIECRLPRGRGLCVLAALLLLGAVACASYGMLFCWLLMLLPLFMPASVRPARAPRFLVLLALTALTGYVLFLFGALLAMYAAMQYGASAVFEMHIA